MVEVRGTGRGLPSLPKARYGEPPAGSFTAPPVPGDFIPPRPLPRNPPPAAATEARQRPCRPSRRYQGGKCNLTPDEWREFVILPALVQALDMERNFD